VQNRLKGRVGSQKMLIACAYALAFLSRVVRFYRYAYSTTWHCVHGNHTEIGERRIRLPILWWKEPGSGWNDESLVERGVLSLVRAYPTGSFDQPRIVIRPAGTWEVGATDEEIRESMQGTIAQMNQGSKTGWSYSLVILTLRNHRMYCVRDDLNQFGANQLVMLNCSAAKMPYSFGYSGPATQEKEAESILSTLD
jgi:hypothetical protein